MELSNLRGYSQGLARIVTIAALALAPIGAGCTSGELTGNTSEELRPSQHEALRTEQRRLWEEHVQWTRMVIVSFAAGLPDFEDAVSRLLQNQQDIGNSIKPFYGDAAGDQLTALLVVHITTAAEVLQAAKAGDADALADASRRWYENGDQIADFLSAANPTYWPRDAMRDAMRHHLDTTLAEASARLMGNWEADIAAYDAAREHVLMMADTLADGIAGQFPNQSAYDPSTVHEH